MIVPFDALPETARVWIYQSDRSLQPGESDIIKSRISGFLEKWTAHGNTLHAGVDIVHAHFIIIGLDESLSGASGCSIDSLFRDLSALGKELNVDFFNRELIAFFVNNKVKLIRRGDLKTFFTEVNAEVLTFNNLVSTKGALEQTWLQAAKFGWLKRYMPTVTV
ncbi:hypothetical protein SanaruYs_12180 [Chryseotalea sanaruensis]|uniref:ABC transporter ATPase n=1 Tax=Chryseotalea sanaruensis TaxID=2482724 RepID=A0A401U7X6_9BACT|nr:hypothetical protein [Chryseotalea sanaruensis]GCC50998.1 hypothetical protein SanaruYs_12180 [Chryseotalea sanaruensis]